MRCDLPSRKIIRLCRFVAKKKIVDYGGISGVGTIILSGFVHQNR